MPPNIPDDVLTFEFNQGIVAPGDCSKLLLLMELTSPDFNNRENVVDNFSRKLLETLGYEYGPRTLI
jgi:hypothetical protein